MTNHDAVDDGDASACHHDFAELTGEPRVGWLTERRPGLRSGFGGPAHSSLWCSNFCRSTARVPSGVIAMEGVAVPPFST